MDCERALNLISARLDNEISPDDRSWLEAHLAECADCRTTAASFVLQDEELRTDFAPRRAAVAATATQVAERLPTKAASKVPSSNYAAALRIAIVPVSMLLVFVTAVVWLTVLDPSGRDSQLPKADQPVSPALVDSSKPEMPSLTPRPRPESPPPSALAVGGSVTTPAGQRQRLALPDHSVLYVDQKTDLTLESDHTLSVRTGSVYVESAPGAAVLSVTTPMRRIMAEGRFAVRALANATDVLVTQGMARVNNVSTSWEGEVKAGQFLPGSATQAEPAPRASYLLDWTRDLMAAAETPLIPSSRHAGGSLLAVDANGQEAKLGLRNFTIDVVIEDGFARTTIDQTYFNHHPFRLEGTFFFPLPADASLSRLAMYVDGDLMEGGMAERDYARSVYQRIVNNKRDPALLEWVDGTTFKMRVFPLEGRQEKRIILCYTQRLPALYGRMTYRFPAGHSLQVVDHWRFRATVKDGQKQGLVFHSPSHPTTHAVPGFPPEPGLQEDKADPNDLRLFDEARGVKVDRDVVLEFDDPLSGVALAPREHEQHAFGHSDHYARFAIAELDGQSYLMARYCPELPGQLTRQRRDWVFLFEASADRDPLLARTQLDLVRHLLANANSDDTFMVLTANSRVHAFKPEPVPVTPANVAAAVAFLERAHLVGALDLASALDAAGQALKKGANPHLVHLGSGLTAIGTKQDRLLEHLPNARYIGIGVGKRWSRDAMKQAAEKTGGHFTQVNPDEPVAWRAFELMATLDTPRLLEAAVESENGASVPFLMETTTVCQGEELCAVARLTSAVPASVVVRGRVNGADFRQVVPVKNVKGDKGYLPRTWARLEIERLLANPQHKKEEVVTLSKEMYVMTPYTSLLVLENEAMYAEFKVDRGRKDHWAMYDLKAKVPVKQPEYDLTMPADVRNAPKGLKPAPSTVMQTVVTRESPRFVNRNNNKVPWLGDLPYLGVAFATSGEDFGVELGLQRPVQFNRNSYHISNQGAYLPDVRWAATYDINGLGNRLIRESVHDRYYAGGFQSMREGDPLIAPDGGYLSQKDINGDVTRIKNYIGYDGMEVRVTPIPVHGQDIPGLVRMHYQVEEQAPVRVGRIIIQGNTRTQDKVILRNLDIYPGLMLRYPEFGEFYERTRESEELGYYDPANALIVRGGSRITSRPTSPTSNFANATGGYIAPGITVTSTINPSNNPGFQFNQPSIFPQQAPLNAARHFTDLVAYAPGLNTSTADLQAVLEAEAAPDLSQAPGHIDPAANELLEAARRGPWRKVTLIDGVTLRFDGAGRFAYNRTLPLGLHEQVICDGKTLWYLYPELGLAARRTVSRFHRRGLLATIPWLAPPAADLARGADVKLVGERTIAIVPHRLLDATGAEMPAPTYQIRIVFAEDGRLAERRRVELATQKVVAREIYDGQGEVHLVQGEDKEIASWTMDLPSTEAPDLVPATRDLVVLPLPLRSSRHVWDKLGLELAQNLNEELNAWYRCLDQDSATQLLTSALVEHRGDWAQQIFRTCFSAHGDQRIGLYVLLAACGLDVSAEPAFKHHLTGGSTPLARYLMLVTGNSDTWLQDRWPVNAGSANTVDDGWVRTTLLRATGSLARSENIMVRMVRKMLERATPEGDFLHELATMRDLMRRWETAPGAGTPMTRARDLQKSLDYVVAHRHSDVGRSLLLTIQAASAGQPAARWRALADTWEILGSDGDYHARYEQASCLLQAGDRAASRARFLALYEEAFASGFLPPLDRRCRQALEEKDAAQDAWAPLLRNTAARLVKDNNRRAAVALAVQVFSLDDRLLADNLLGIALSGELKKEEKAGVYLAAFGYLGLTIQPARAEALLGELLDAYPKAPALWRLAAALADKRGQRARSITCLEHALDLEYANLPDVIALEQWRADYGRLLAYYEEQARTLRDAGRSASADLAVRTVRAVDRWRAHDPEPGNGPQTAAATLALLGRRDLAWDYHTTPFAGTNGADRSLAALAANLAREGYYDLAENAYAAASAAEPANGELTWDRAQNLRQTGKAAEADRLLRALVDDTNVSAPLRDRVRWQLGERGGAKP